MREMTMKGWRYREDEVIYKEGYDLMIALCWRFCFDLGLAGSKTGLTTISFGKEGVCLLVWQLRNE